MLEYSPSNSHRKTVSGFLQDWTIHSTTRRAHLPGTAERSVQQATTRQQYTAAWSNVLREKKREPSKTCI